MNQVITVPEPTPQSEMLLTELDLGASRSRYKPQSAPIELVVVRELTEDDLPAIMNPPKCDTPPAQLSKLRHSHHHLAQLIAAGKEGPEIAMLTGYSVGHLQTLKGDPAFEELIQYYASQREIIFADVAQRLRLIGLDATEKLQELLNDPEKKWSSRELMEVIEMTVVKPMEAKAGAKGQGMLPPGGVNLQVQFVGAQPQSLEAKFSNATELDGKDVG